MCDVILMSWVYKYTYPCVSVYSGCQNKLLVFALDECWLQGLVLQCMNDFGTSFDTFRPLLFMKPLSTYVAANFGTQVGLH